MRLEDYTDRPGKPRRKNTRQEWMDASLPNGQQLTPPPDPVQRPKLDIIDIWYKQQMAAAKDPNKDKIYLEDKDRVNQQFDKQKDRAETVRNQALEDAAGIGEDEKARAHRTLAAMSRYLPQLQESQGIAGMGAAASDQVALRNEYYNDVAKADRAQKKAMTDINRGYEETMAGIEEGRADSMEAIMEAYRGRAGALNEKNSDRVLQGLEKNAEGMFGQDGKITLDDYKALYEYTTKNWETLTDEGKMTAKDALDAYKSFVRGGFPEQVENTGTNTRVGNTAAGYSGSKYRTGKNFVASFKKETYNVETGELSTNQEANALAEGMREGTIFALGDTAYVKGQNGVFEVQAQFGRNKEYNALMKTLKGTDHAEMEAQVGKTAASYEHGKYKEEKNLIVDMPGYGRYYVETGEAATDPMANELAQSVSNGTVFAVGDTVYVKGENGLFKVRARFGMKKEYEKLLKSLKNTGGK